MKAIEGECRRWLCKRARRKVRDALAAAATVEEAAEAAGLIVSSVAHAPHAPDISCLCGARHFFGDRIFRLAAYSHRLHLTTPENEESISLSRHNEKEFSCPVGRRGDVH